jgi:hypothetical protein
MLDFSEFLNTTGAFPNVEATDSSGPTLRDGTPINANLINDIWGAFQAILNAAGVTPSEGVESSSASDLLDSIRKLVGAPGEIVMYATPSDVIAANILPLKGQTLTITSYQALVDATYIGNSNNSDLNFGAFYKCSDLSGVVRNTAGPYFRIPDCRGLFLRALAGATTGVDMARDWLTTEYSVDFRNMSGSSTAASPGWHIHDVKGLSTRGLNETLQYVMTSNPGNITGSTGTVATYQTYMYRGLAGISDVTTEIGRTVSPAVDYSESSYADEVRPINTAFQLGIRY